LKKIQTEIPNKLEEFISELIDEGYFNSKKDYARCSIELMAQLYGYTKKRESGKDFLIVLTDNLEKIQEKLQPKQIVQTVKPTETKKGKVSKEKEEEPEEIEPLTQEELKVLDLFMNINYEYEEALHARYTMEAMKLGQPPLPLEQFQKVLKNLEKKKKLSQSIQKGRTLWKLEEE
jgi:Arc/MetJ-type ribon-helix-helix transcriptional regulator